MQLHKFMSTQTCLQQNPHPNAQQHTQSEHLPWILNSWFRAL